MENKRYRPDLPQHFEPFIKELRKLSLNDLENLSQGNFSDVDISTTETTTQTNQYEAPSQMTALNKEGKTMTLEEYCEFYGLDYNRAKSSKLVTHTGVPYYNIAFDDRDAIEDVDWEDVMFDIQKELSQIKYNPIKSNGAKVGVVKLADLHLGALIEGMLKTKDYSTSILANQLYKAAQIINRLGYAEVHVHILGDLIESFTGLNHRNSWKNMEKGMFGAEAVKACVRILHECFLSKIHNLKTVKIIAGNHDRVTSDKGEDTDGDAANLISWGLGLIGYDVEFSPSVLSHYVDGINYINTHGHLGISRMTTKDVCWDYGKQGVFNVIAEGHLHSIIQKLSVAQRRKFQTVKDSSVDHLRFNCPSFFTGNDYSENLGYTSQAGFTVFENNGDGVPNQFNFAL